MKILLFVAIIILFGVCVGFLPTVLAEEGLIPLWIKTNAIWWSNGLVTDKEFASGLAYVVKENIIEIENVDLDTTDTVVISDDLTIPKWIHNNTRWWVDDLISDDEFKSGIEFMFKEGIISFSESFESQPISNFKICNSTVDKNHDGIPDDLTPQKGIDWSYCNLQDTNFVGQDLSQANLIGADLRGSDLQNSDLSFTNLANADLRNAKLIGADLRGSDLQNSDLTLTNLANADLRNAKLIGANLLHSNLNNANMYQTNLLGANLYAANLQGANFKEAILIQANIYKSNLQETIFIDADLTQANFCGQSLTVRNDFTGADFTGADLSNTKLKDVNFETTILIDADLSGADLSGVNLSNKDLTGTFLFNANLTYANLQNTILSGVDLRNTDLTNTDLSGSDLTNSFLHGANIHNTILTGADLTNADYLTEKPKRDLSTEIIINENLLEKDFSNEVLYGVDLSGRNLQNVNFESAILTNANLSGSDLSGANFLNTILLGSNLEESNLSNVDLSTTILTGVNLKNSNLTNVDLSGLSLTDVNLSGANLSDKDLTGTMFASADLSGANLSNMDLTQTVLVGANLDGANLSGVNLSGSDLTGVIITNANLKGANLSGVDLSDKDLTGTILENANLHETKLPVFSKNVPVSYYGEPITNVVNSILFNYSIQPKFMDLEQHNPSFHFIFHLIPELSEIYEEIGLINEPQNAVVIYPSFTAAAYAQPAMYTYWPDQIDDYNLTVDLPPKSFITRSYHTSSIGAQVLNLLGYDFITDEDVDRNPSILKKYDKVILLHNEFVTQKEFDAIISHPKVVYLYSNSLYVKVETNYDDRTITRVTPHHWPDESMRNDFNWEYDSTQFEYVDRCAGLKFKIIDNGIMLPCYPELDMGTSINLLKMIKDY